MNRILIDLKEDCHSDIVGRVVFSSDSVFVLEALAEVIKRFSEACGVATTEILSDLGALAKN